MNMLIVGAIAFIAGFAAAWIWRTVHVQQVKKNIKSTQGYLESERLIRDTLQKENKQVYLSKEALEADLQRQLKEAHRTIRQMDQDIILLQKSNEETEALLQAGEPVIHSLKLKLIEANNTIARYKAQLNQQAINRVES
ncbi:MAG TPA: hypothetical protein PKK69_05575 [Ferruginibacter sp.]|nr:hypothetical protein [Ferruginibacter sp.]